jgi:hypothetical protein
MNSVLGETNSRALDGCRPSGPQPGCGFDVTTTNDDGLIERTNGFLGDLPTLTDTV